MHTDCIDGALYAVILAVFCRKTKRFLFLKELTSKPTVFKTKGMLAFPSETKDASDKSVRATVARLIYEEIGVSLGDDFYLYQYPLEHFIHEIPVYVSVIMVENEFCACPRDTDVDHGAWLDKEDIRTLDSISNFFRIETMSVLNLLTTTNESALT